MPGVKKQVSIFRQSPGYNKSYVNTELPDDLNSPLKISVIYNNGAEYTDNLGRDITNGYTFFVSDNTQIYKVPTTKTDESGTHNLIEDLPQLDGLVGLNATNSTNANSISYYDNFTIQSDINSGEDIPVYIPKVFKRGDANMDYNVDISDAIYSLEYLFQGGIEPTCLDAMDANDDGNIDLADSLKMLFYQYTGAFIPPPNKDIASGIDLTADSLNCEISL